MLTYNNGEPKLSKPNYGEKIFKNAKEPIFLKVKNSLLELEKDFIQLKDIELKDIEVKIKREIEKKKKRFEKKKKKKEIRPIKQTWYDWLINYIPKPIRKSVDGFEDKIIS